MMSEIHKYADLESKIFDRICIKPPLGAKPYSIAASDRIAELGGAVVRAATDPMTRINTAFVRAWAHEIMLQCDLIEQMEGEQHERSDRK